MSGREGIGPLPVASIGPLPVESAGPLPVASAGPLPAASAGPLPVEAAPASPLGPAPDFIGQVDVAVAPPQLVGAGPLGERRVIPILGGRVSGPRLEGEVLPGGADFQLIRPDGVAEIEARYTLRLADGALVYVVNRGLRHAAPEDMARLLRGEPVPPERVYFRTAPAFETASPAHGWLHRSLFIGMGERRPDSVRVRIYAV